MIQSWLPDPKRIRENQALRPLGARLHHPALWHLNRRSVSGGLAVGIFCALIPLPFQMFIAAALAFWLRVNLPLAVVTVWITNPVTMPAVFYGTYQFGAWLLDSDPLDLNWSMSVEWARHNLEIIWQPLIVGSLTAGVILASLTYVGVSLAWRWSVISTRRAQLALRKRRKQHRHHANK